MKTASVTINKDRSKKESAYAYIKEQIVSNRFEPGTVLVERNLCDATGTSRTPIREALQRLVSEGLIQSTPSRGYIVSEIRYEDIARTYDVREYLEALASHLCAQSITASQVEILRDYLSQMVECMDANRIPQMLDIDNQFHRYIVQNSQNDLLISIFDNVLFGQIRRITRLIEYSEQGMTNSLRLHRALVEAMARHDAEAAESLMREHIQSSKQYLLQLFAPNTLPSKAYQTTA